MTETLENVTVQCPGCGWKTSFSLDDQWINVENAGVDKSLIKQSSLPGIIADFSSKDLDESIICFWRNLSCEDCGESSTVVSFLADTSEISGSKKAVQERVEELRREKQVVEPDPSKIDQEMFHEADGEPSKE